jgi:hypothetical protein
MSGRPLPDVAAILAPLLGGVRPVERPLLLAIAERMAAERYRRWASEVDAADVRAGLLACAAREDEIASRVEGVYGDAATVQQRLRAEHPFLACAPLEEASAVFLEGLLARGAAR